MSVGMVLLTVVAVLVFFGVAQRVLDKLHLSDRAALVLIALMFFGTLIPNVQIGSVSVSIGGAVIPLGVCVYLLARAGTAKERVRAVLGALITAGIIYALSHFLPDEPERMLIDPMYLYGLAGGVVAYVLGRSRRGAFFCGVVGVKPAYGAVSRYGLVAFASSLDQIGPLCKTAADAALVLDAICGGDPHDMTSDPTLAQPCAVREARDLSGLTVGLPRECFGEGLDQQVCAAVEAAAEALHRLGMQVREVSIPSLPYALPAYYVISSAEASSNLARFDGVRYGYRARAYADLDELYRKSRQEGFGMEVKRRIMLGTFALSSGYQDQYYLKALKARELLRYEAAEALKGCAALLSPVAPTPAYRLGEKTGDPMKMYLGDIYTVPANITGLPAVSVPCGRSAEGLPIGMSLMGARDSLPLLMDIAGTYERAARVNEGVHPYDAVEGEART